MNIDKMNRDERLFGLAVLEAVRVCETLEARCVYVKKKLERVQIARLSRAKSEAGGAEHLRTLDRHRAEHYATSLPWEVLEDSVQEWTAFLERLNASDLEQLESRGGQ